jgi:hypothetical protein
MTCKILFLNVTVGLSRISMSRTKQVVGSKPVYMTFTCISELIKERQLYDYGCLHFLLNLGHQRARLITTMKSSFITTHPDLFSHFRVFITQTHSMLNARFGPKVTTHARKPGKPVLEFSFV